MPESCTDRPTSAWEHIFLLSKSQKYFYDAEAVKEKAKWAHDKRAGDGRLTYEGKRQGQNGTGQEAFVSIQQSANLRNFWLLGPEPYPEAHFATFPTEIPRRAIRAGTSQKGCCPVCAAPWERVVEKKEASKTNPRPFSKPGNEKDRNDVGRIYREQVFTTTGWAPTCSCDAGEPAPCVVLDPFMGSGTTAVVAQNEGRRWIGIDISEEYCNLAIRRIQNEAAQYSMSL
tara:strand:+ start:56 stop:742 length:687 start_codon:yes stop_codon:yes gene_type:complete